jgi:hypothetical protein
MCSVLTSLCVGGDGVADTERHAHRLVPPAEVLAHSTPYVRLSKTGPHGPVALGSLMDLD